MLGPYAVKYADAIWGRLAAEAAPSLDDVDIDRILGPCVGAQFLVPAAKELRDANVLYFDGVVRLAREKIGAES
jgi:hypothetical protein